MSTSVDELLASLAAGKEQAAEDYEAVIVKLHAGEKIPGAEVKMILDTLGKDHIDLQQRLSELAHRDELRAKRQRYQQTAARVAELQREIEAHGRFIEQELDRLRRQIFPQRQELGDLHQILIAGNFEQELRSCPANKRPFEKLQRAQRRLQVVNQEATTQRIARNQAATLLADPAVPKPDPTGWNRADRPIPTGPVTGEQAENLRRKIASHDEQIQALDSEAEELRSEIARLNQEIMGD